MFQINFKQLALKKIHKLFTGLTIGIFFILATYGANLSWNAHMNGQMQGCQLMAEMTQVCQMDVMQHIAGWQKLFLAVFQSDGFLFFLLSIVTIAAAFCFFERFRLFSSFYDFFIPHSRNRKAIGWRPYSYLVQSFSMGILCKRE